MVGVRPSYIQDARFLKVNLYKNCHGYLINFTYMLQNGRVWVFFCSFIPLSVFVYCPVCNTVFECKNVEYLLLVLLYDLLILCMYRHVGFNPLKPQLNPICYLLALLAHHFLHVSRISVKSLTLRLLMSYTNTNTHTHKYIYIYTYDISSLRVNCNSYP